MLVKLEIVESVKENPINLRANNFNLTTENVNHSAEDRRNSRRTATKLTNLRNEIKYMNNMEESTFKIKLSDPNLKRISTSNNISSK